MKNTLRHILPILSAVITLTMLLSCSTQKNTKASRWWHSFNARYNTYYNGSVAYIDASEQKDKGNKDNYTERIPLYTVGNKASRELGKSQYETAITKAQKAIKLHSIKQRPEWNKTRRKTERDIEWLNRKEYNPFIWKAWMLMGRSQFYKGSFDEAAATFSYMSRLYRTQPAIYGKARAWLAKCYIEQDWIYDAEDVIRNMQRDSIDWKARKEWDYTMADYYLHTGDLENATLFLRKVIRHEMRSKQRAREYFLLGQILAAQGKSAEAYQAFRSVVRQNPPYELEFNARIAMTEVMSGQQAKSKIRRLRRMARSDKNIEYLDQVYYAIGNIHLSERDTMKAIYAYEEGNAKAKRSGVEKGVLLLHLGDLYWQKERFGDAKRCYGEAIGLIDKDRKDYEQLAYRAKVLDELAPHTDAIHLQDSLQALARMDEKSRNAAIDRVIEALKKKEKEERLKELEAEAQKNGSQQSSPSSSSPAAVPQNTNRTGSSTWYFYNPMAVQQGKQTFQKQWGKRENADDWQRSNKTVVASMSEESDTSIADADSLSLAVEEEKEEAPKDSSALDPHKREYYLAQIPFTPEQVEASNAIISESLFGAGKIFLDKMDSLRLSEKSFMRLTTSFPDFSKNSEVYYYLYLINSRRGEQQKATTYKDLLVEKYPDDAFTKLISDPHYAENARYGIHREDSLYADAYEAFRNGVENTIERNARISEERYPDGAHRDKFLFLSGMSRLASGDADSCLAAMNRIVKEYPKSDVSTIAGMIINGVSSGRRLRTARFDISDIWNIRTVNTSEEADTTQHSFSDNPDEPYVFLLTYSPDTLTQRSGPNAENILLYEVARHNFTSYLVRNFEIFIEDFQGMARLVISGFNSHDEALAYARSLYSNNKIASLAAAGRGIVISQQNMELLGRQFSYNEYEEFYNTHLAKDNVALGSSILNEIEISPEMYDPEIQGVEKNVEETPSPSESSDDGFIISEPEKPASTTPDTDIVIPETPSAKEAPADSDDVIIVPETNENASPSDNSIVIPEEPEKKESEKKEPAPKTALPVTKPVQGEVQKQQTPVRQEINADIIEIIDTEGGASSNGSAAKGGASSNGSAAKGGASSNGSAAKSGASSNGSAAKGGASSNGSAAKGGASSKTGGSTATKKENKTKQEKEDDEYFDFEGF